MWKVCHLTFDAHAYSVQAWIAANGTVRGLHCDDGQGGPRIRDVADTANLLGVLLNDGVNFDQIRSQRLSPIGSAIVASIERALEAMGHAA